MKALFLALLALATLPSLASANQCGTSAPGASALEQILLKKAKLAHDEGILDVQGFTACRQPGQSCRGSLDCCGGNACRDGMCGGGNCTPTGGRCGDSIECCGAAPCDGGRCGATDNSCGQRGARCGSSLDCCGSNFCSNGACG
ncbi:MAG: hypothetical protein EOP11_21940 [Proteobacteria bacterium]|nr:MAG: hypothetical protein EOP11_21940 [Pseudomonadota bacterium]